LISCGHFHSLGGVFNVRPGPDSEGLEESPLKQGDGRDCVCLTWVTTKLLIRTTVKTVTISSSDLPYKVTVRGHLFTIRDVYGKITITLREYNQVQTCYPCGTRELGDLLLVFEVKNKYTGTKEHGEAIKPRKPIPLEPVPTGVGNGTGGSSTNSQDTTQGIVSVSAGQPAEDPTVTRNVVRVWISNVNTKGKYDPGFGEAYRVGDYSRPDVYLGDRLQAQVWLTEHGYKLVPVPTSQFDVPTLYSYSPSDPGNPYWSYYLAAADDAIIPTVEEGTVDEEDLTTGDGLEYSYSPTSLNQTSDSSTVDVRTGSAGDISGLSGTERDQAILDERMGEILND